MDENSFGIPVTKGKILATGKNGVVVLFNLRHLLLQKLLRAQLYSSDQQILTIPISPHVRVTDIYTYPQLNSIVDFAFAQQEYTAIVFINSIRLPFKDSLRIIFWFKRNVILGTKDTDKIDLPDEFIPLLIAETTKNFCLHVGKPIPEDVERTIKEGEQKIKNSIPIQNYYVNDTFNLSIEDLNKLDKSDAEIEKIESKKETTKIAPIKYLPKHYKEVDNLRKQLKASAAIEKIANKYGFSFEGFKQQYYSLWYNKKK